MAGPVGEREEISMGLYLVVAHQTAASPELLEAVRKVMARELEAEFVLLVPATPVTHLLT